MEFSTHIPTYNATAMASNTTSIVANSTADDSPHIDDTLDYVFLPIYILEGIAIMLSNSLVVASFVKFDFVRSVDNYFLLSLSVADFLTGPSLIGSSVITKFYVDSVAHGPLCILAGAFQSFAFVCQIWSILLATIDRFLCIHYPMRTPRPLTGLVAKVLIVLVWAANGLMMLMLTVYHQWKPGTRCYTLRILNEVGMKYVALPLSGIPLLVMPVLYSIIIRTALRHAVQIRDQINALADPRLGMRSHQLKMTKTLRFILGLLYLSWVPAMLSVLVEMLDKSVEAVVIFQRLYNDLVTACIFASSFLNPLVYHWSNPTFQKAFRYILFPKKAREHYRNLAIQEMLAEQNGENPLEIGVNVNGNEDRGSTQNSRQFSEVVVNKQGPSPETVQENTNAETNDSTHLENEDNYANGSACVENKSYTKIDNDDDSSERNENAEHDNPEANVAECPKSVAPAEKLRNLQQTSSDEPEKVESGTEDDLSDTQADEVNHKQPDDLSDTKPDESRPTQSENTI